MTDTQTQKDIYFYSDYCTHCKDASKFVGDEKFVQVNIDTNKVPEFIDRVPAILTSEKKILYEEELFEYLERLQKTKEAIDAEPFMIHEMKGISDRYSYMDETNAQLSHTFDFLNAPTKIITPTETDAKQILNYEEILAKIDNDLKNNIGI